MKIETNIIDVIKSWCIDKANLITSWSATSSDEKVPSEKLVKNELDKKIDKTSIKTSVTSSLTDDDVVGGKALYDKILAVEAGIPDGMKHTDIEDWDTATSGFEETSNKVTSIRSTGATDTAYPTEKAVKSALDTAKTTADGNYAAKSHNHTTSNISNWSTATSGFQTTANLETSVSTSTTKYPSSSAVSNALSSAKSTADNTYATKTSLISGLAGKIDTNAKTTSIDSTSSDTQVPSAKAVYALYDSIPKWDVKVAASVSDLPTTGQLGTIYLIKNSGSGTSSYDEYFWNDDSTTPGYEKFGGVEIDLTGFVKMPEVVSYIGNNASLSLADDGTLSFTLN